MRRIALLAILLVALAAAPAAAHDDEGTMTVTAAEQLDGLQVRLEVGVVHLDDDLAEEATVTAVLVGPDGTSVGPVQLAHLTGARYGAEVFLPAPGDWAATITSTGPAAEAAATISVEVGAPTTSSSAPATTTTTTAAPRSKGSQSRLGWVLAGLAGVGSVVAFTRGQRRKQQR